MMDGRIEHIRELLEKKAFTILHRVTVQHASFVLCEVRFCSRVQDKTYQMDFHNSKEALTETQLDIEEGADIVMVKPGIAYLDIIRDLANEIETPIAAYQVSGEYAMLKAAAAKGWVDYDAIVYEQLIAFKRAGASLIASYFAKDAVRILKL